MLTMFNKNIVSDHRNLHFKGNFIQILELQHQCKASLSYKVDQGTLLFQYVSVTCNYHCFKRNCKTQVKEKYMTAAGATFLLIW